uniref:EF-hand domain-containing protein n=2 Tax=Oncorhynchus TaxID=8016 RepID=A0A8C7M1I0_ONCMY
MPSELERSMESLIMVFHLYSEKDGDGNTLSKKELKELMKTELASFLKSQKDPAAIDTIMKDLDQNGDGKCILLSAAMPSQLERSLQSLITVFHRYADKDGDCNTLSKKELKELMQTELGSFLKSQKDPAAIDKIMKDLDQNGDGKVNFEEFVSLVVGLSIACEQIYQLHTQKASAKK